MANSMDTVAVLANISAITLISHIYMCVCHALLITSDVD